MMLINSQKLDVGQYDYNNNNNDDNFEVDIQSNIMAVTVPKSEMECMETYKNRSSISIDGDDDEVRCPAAWDSFFCWPPVSVGEDISVPCEQIFPFIREGNDLLKGFARRKCGTDGQWLWGNWTNYSDCVDRLPDEDFVSPVAISYIIFVGSIISLISLVISLFIFIRFKSIQCARIRVHRNLIVSLILHSLMMVTIALPGLFDGVIEQFRNTNWLCKTILTLKMYSAMTCIYWMFVEGHLLHSSITVSVFQNEAPFKLYYATGWGIPLVCVLTWAVLMDNYTYTKCWRGYGKSSFIWLITGPMILALVINTIFLVNIIRILITKLKMSTTLELKQIRKAIKATALLFPLLGITHLLFCINPRDDAHLERAYMITNAILQSSQGLFVALLYCFLNSEVQSVVMSWYSRFSVRHQPNRSFKNKSRFLGSFSNTTSVSHHHHPSKHGNGCRNHINDNNNKSNRSQMRKVSMHLIATVIETPLQPSEVTNDERTEFFVKETSFID